MEQPKDFVDQLRIELAGNKQTLVDLQAGRLGDPSSEFSKRFAAQLVEVISIIEQQLAEERR